MYIHSLIYKYIRQYLVNINKISNGCDFTLLGDKIKNNKKHSR